MKKEFNKDIEILKNNQIEMKSQHPPNKTSVEGMYNSVEQVENGVS
jgi:hypothetical protein